MVTKFYWYTEVVWGLGSKIYNYILFVVLKIDALSRERVNGQQLKERSILVAQSLLANGVQVGDSVGIITSNRLEFACVLVGSFMCGATVSPLNVTYTKGKVFKQLLSVTSALKK